MNELVALDDAGLRGWAREHPGEARRLAERPMEGADGEAGEFALALRRLEPGLRREDVSAVNALWSALAPETRARWTVQYPGVIGPLNGIDFPSRVRANIIVAAGLLARLDVAERAAERAAGPLPSGGTGLWASLRNAWALRRWGKHAGRQALHVQRQIDGLRFAVHSLPETVGLLHVSADGDGQFVAISGALSAGTRSIAVFVPGTFTFGNHLQMNLSRLSGVDGHAEHPDTSVGIYWQGSEFPHFVWDNVDSRFNRTARTRLACFDAALDLEQARVQSPGVPPAPQTYIGHSYGASAIGSAESVDEGLTLDRLVYVGAPGTGFRVDVPADTVNPDADRYSLVTPTDWKPWLGGTLFGKAMGGDPVRDMGAEQLETGFFDHAGRRSRLLSHNAYLHTGSTAALNIQAVVLGGRTLPAVLRHPWPWGRMSDRHLKRRIDGLRLPR